jgi:hypothetical protein
MRSQFVVIDGVGRKDSPQVSLAEDDDVIKVNRPGFSGGCFV